MNSYDEIKGMLNKVRKIQNRTKLNSYGMIKEQEDTSDQTSFEGGASNLGAQPANPNPSQPSHEGNDFAVINDVEVEIHSEDPEDLQLSDEEKGKISQLIDDFRAEVSELVEFDKLHVYEDSAKLDGKITDIGLGFTLSTGNDTGLYISNASLLKIDDNSFGMLNKLKVFEVRFANSINDLLVNRRST
jgi:hypothetical protein